MALSPGTRLGGYEIVGPLGAGGMGEVYRARDPRLNRDVAIKVLPDPFADDPERVARFEREAQLLAAVNHPHIAAIYGIEGRAIILELVEGSTLAERLNTGPLSVGDAVPIAIQIAEALESAHERGVVHRDLKPANIKLTPDGNVKVLDFGLAKLLDTHAPEAQTSQSPTFTAQGTFAGVILGTAPYMSPEQARGRAVDKRTDIWAFGCVLFEMLSGTRAFAGDDVTETLGAIIHKEPAWDSLPASVPAHIQTLLRRCLQKNAKERLRDIGDARIELSTSTVVPPPPAPPATSRWAWGGWITAAVLALVFAALAFAYSSRVSAPSLPLVRFQLSSGQAALSGLPPAVSPDGRMVAYVTREAFGRPGIWVRSLDGLEPRRLTNTSNLDGMVFWSPDSRSIAFSAAGVLRKIDVDSGATTTIGDIPGGAYRGGDWNRNGVILIGSRLGLFQMKDGGAVAVSRVVEGDAMHATPSFLPDGRRFVFLRAGQTGHDGFYVGALDSPPESQLSHRLAIDASGGQLVAEENAKVGYFFFTRKSALLVQPFDLAQMTPLGEPGIISEGVPTTTTFAPRLFSAGGSTLAYRGTDTFEAELRWFDRGGKDLGRVGNVAGYSALDISRDGRLAVVEQSNPQTGLLQLWSIDLVRGVATRVNPGEQADIGPALSVDGRVAFTRVSPGSPGLGDLYRRAVNGTGELELLWQSPNLKHPNDWSPDGRFLIFDEHHPTQQQDLWVLPIEGERKPQPVLATPADETLAQFSPDGRWILYRSDESGRIEIYLRDFAPGRSPAVGDQKWTISRNGGDRPRWSPDGKAVYYIDLDRRMTRVPLVGSGATLQPGSPEPLFGVNPIGFTPYDLTPDGRFLVSSVASEDGQQSVPITVVLNWQRLLER